MRRRRVRTHGLSPFAIATATALIAGALFTAAPAGADPAWTITPSPNPTTALHSDLVGVACTGASSCFAIGSSQAANQTYTQLLEHWNGSAWTLMANPRGMPSAKLFGIACPATANCFAVGARAGKALAEFWNGRAWSVMKTPSPSGVRVGLTRLACPTRTSCFAAGSYWPTANRMRPLVEHWNGKTWAIMTTPALADGYMALNAIACPSAKSCFTVGSRFANNRETTLVEHWNGTKWATMTSANVAAAIATQLNGVSCPNTTTCFAVGTSAYPTRSYQEDTPVIERWNGSHWTIVASPVPADDGTTPNNATSLNDVRCASATNCLTVGVSGAVYSQIAPGGSSEHTLAEHWNGATWTIVPSARPDASFDDAFYSLTCVGAGPCFGVGRYEGTPTCTDTSCTQPEYTLAEKYA